MRMRRKHCDNIDSVEYFNADNYNIQVVPLNTAVPDLSTYRTLMPGFAFIADTYLTPLTYTNATTNNSGCDADSCENGMFAAVRQVTWSDGVSNKICLCTKPVVSWADTIARFSRVSDHFSRLFYPENTEHYYIGSHFDSKRCHWNYYIQQC